MGGLAYSAIAPSGSAMSEPARDKFLDSFYDKTDPALPAAERERQAKAALKLHMTRLSHAAARARSKAARANSEAIHAEAEVIAASADTV